MTTTTAPAVLFRLPDDVGKSLPSPLRDFVLLDDPEDTQAALKASDIRDRLDAEAGSALRYRLNVQGRENRAYWLKRAERFARVAAELSAARQSLDDRWSKQDQGS